MTEKDLMELFDNLPPYKDDDLIIYKGQEMTIKGLKDLLSLWARIK